MSRARPSNGRAADLFQTLQRAWQLFMHRFARAMNRINVHPSAARMMVILVVGFTLVGASLVIARNALENARRVPVARMFNPRLAEERHRMTLERAELIRRCIGAYAAVHGSLPANLNQLVPEFLPGIPLPLNGATEWEYRVLAPTAGETRSVDPAVSPAGSTSPGFSLAFRTWGHPILRQTVVDQDGRWTLAE